MVHFVSFVGGIIAGVSFACFSLRVCGMRVWVHCWGVCLVFGGLSGGLCLVGFHLRVVVRVPGCVWGLVGCLWWAFLAVVGTDIF